MAWKKGVHSSHISGGKRWMKSKLVQRRLEKLSKRLKRLSKKINKNNKKEVISHEKGI
jgi:predicted RNA-binding protein with PIN domain